VHDQPLCYTVNPGADTNSSSIDVENTRSGARSTLTQHNPTYRSPLHLLNNVVNDNLEQLYRERRLWSGKGFLAACEEKGIRIDDDYPRINEKRILAWFSHRRQQ
jgi:hypothetical protein